MLSLGFLGCLKPGNASGANGGGVHIDASVGALTGSKPLRRLSVVAGQGVVQNIAQPCPVVYLDPTAESVFICDRRSHSYTSVRSSENKDS